MDPIVLPEHRFGRDELIQLSWTLQKSRIILVYTFLFGLFAVVAALARLEWPFVVAFPLLGIPLGVLYYRYNAIPKTADSPTMANATRTREMKLDDWGLHLTGEDNLMSEVPWSYVVLVRKIPNYTLLFISPVQYFLVPHRLLSPADLLRLDGLIQSHFKAPSR